MTLRDLRGKGFGGVYPILPQNEAKICPFIVTMPTVPLDYFDTSIPFSVITTMQFIGLTMNDGIL
jgi:hypothetical protein